MVDKLFERIKAERAKRDQIFDEICTALVIHADIEEKIFYPSVKARRTEETLYEAVEEHLSVKRVLADLVDMEPSNPKYMAKVEVLKELVKHHVREEENTLFPEVRKMFDAGELVDLGRRMMQMEQQLRQGGESELVRDLVEHTDQSAPI